ncbi:MAG: Transcriptional regulator [uncultured Corynebacteriales bacterium]|uniref:Transcriptional regulator n=1 Tax=uncultured Mycobacteriales bacterium TaxID=581187 RepID=A0A6J4JAR9_9ACTN|nr:MAG: Transcriptional regulator [uncultured Corynebacteriales bacterium]
MARDPAGGPAQLVLTASVARRYYLDGRSKIEIAEEFALSRFKVARLLESARATGLVRIEIGYPGEVDLELSGLLQERFGLCHSVVVDTPDDDIGSLRRRLGAAAADLLGEIVTAEDVLGLGWSRSVSAVAAALTELAPTPVVQLTGALSRPDGDDGSVDVVRDVARISGGPAYFFHAPLLVPDPATARALRRQPEVARAFAQFRSVTKAVVGIGRWAPNQSTVYDAATDRERRALRRQGVCAEVSGVFLTEAGDTLPTALAERMIGVSAAQLRAMREVIGVPYDVVKAPAVRAALRSRLVSGLVTHTSLARALLTEG